MNTGGKGVTAEINVTPLIDVVLVLLIIFMVITPMLQRGHPVQLPQGQDPDKKPDNDEDVIVSVACADNACQKAEFHFHGANNEKENGIGADELRRILTETLERVPSTPLYIKADKRLRYGEVRKAMLLCEGAGFRDVSLVAEAPQ